jgi:hypothetical protein
MIDDRNEYEQTKAWLKANQVSSDGSRDSLFNDHRHAIVASSDPYGLFAEVISEVTEYHYCNGELHIVYDEKGNEIWRIK